MTEEGEGPNPNVRDENRRKVLALMPKGGIAAEIGVWRGDFSARIVEETVPAELHLIDPWQFQPSFPNTAFGSRKNAGLMEELFQGVTARFAGDSRVRIHRAGSDEALTEFPDYYFDWVYIDGNHNAPFIDRDLELSMAKVRPGGIIAGDDFHWKGGGEFPVRRAVMALLQHLGEQATFTRFGQQYVIKLKRDGAAAA